MWLTQYFSVYSVFFTTNVKTKNICVFLHRLSDKKKLLLLIICFSLSFYNKKNVSLQRFESQVVRLFGAIHSLW